MSDPVLIQEVFKLPAVGINPASISFNNVTVESDKFICVREEDGENKVIKIIEVATREVTVNKVNADSAIMNPMTKVLALRGGNKLQIYNLEMRSKMGEYTMNEAVLFWKWITPKMIAIVTSNAVLHWSVEGNAAPVKVFDRNEKLEGATIINYRTDKSLKWLLLCGLKRDAATGAMQGLMQLYSVDRGVTQVIDGHAATFIEFPLTPSYRTTVICIANNSAAQGGGKLFVMEVPSQNKPANVPAFQRQIVPMAYPDPTDFAVAMQPSERHGIVYIITKAGALYLYEVERAFCIFQGRATRDTVFATAPLTATNGLLGVTRGGSVLAVTVNNDVIVPYLSSTLGNSELAIKIAARANLGGADELYVTQFNSLLQTGQVDAAVKLAADSPQGILRTAQTIQRLQRLPAQPGQKPPISAYFSYILENAALNQLESIELSKIVLARPGGIDYVKNLITEGKMECSEALGDMVRTMSEELAMQIYLKGGAHEKIIDTLIMRGDHERITQYCVRVNYTPNHMDVFRKLLGINPDAAVKYAVKVHEGNAQALDSGLLVDMFVQNRMIKAATAYLLEILKDDKPEDGPMQTRLLEINLMFSPVQVADSILAQNYIKLSHYDRQKVAQLCEKANLFQRALENYSDLTDIKRVIVNTQYIEQEWLVEYFQNLDPEERMVCLKELMRVNMMQNLNVVVKVAQRYSEEVGAEQLIRLFESNRSYQGLFFYLGYIIENLGSKDPEVHFKYIESAVRTGKYVECEKVTRESDFYDPEKTKEFLKEAKLQDQMPLINVCDKYDFVEEMVHYFYNNQQLKWIDTYVKQRNPLRTPSVVGALIDVDASEDYIRNIVQSVGNMCPIEPLVNEVEKRSRLKLLQGYLEARVNEGVTEPAAHNALAKIYIDTNHSPQEFLQKNQYYDSRVVGKYCEKRDPQLAFIAYERGQCDPELVEVANKNGMFKQLARYLVKRQAADLWAMVLVESNQYRRSLVDQVVQVALPESANPEHVSSTVKAFMAADMPHELIELLEQIVLHGKSDFRNNKNLQNLLILTAIKAAPARVMGYIDKLDNYDAPDIATIAVEKELYEEAFVIYSRSKMHADAVDVLLNQIGSIERAVEYASTEADVPQVWSSIARAQLAAGLVTDAIESFMRADDASAYHEVIAAAENAEEFEALIKFLRMARQAVHDSHIDTELVYSLARLAKQQPMGTGLADLEDFIGAPHSAQLQNVGDRCFEEGLYEAARILFTATGNFARLAQTLVKLQRFKEAVQAAQKANNMRTWKEVMAACVDAGEFRLAQSCALNIIVHADELEDLIHYYEVRGHIEHIIAVLEKGLGLERAHMGIFTQLGILYAKYRPEALMDHITRNWRRCHIPRLLTACETNALWAEMRFLYTHHDEYDNAVRVMMDHPADAFDHAVFLETAPKVVNPELYYKAVHFYLEEQPDKVVDLLMALQAKLDHERVAREVRAAGQLPFIRRYLEAVQEANLVLVNETLNSLYIEEEDYEALRASIEAHGNFDQVALAKSLERHELLEFRRIAARLYRNKKQYASSIDLSKKDKLYRDAMETAAESNDAAVVEDLLKFFVDNQLSECFAAALYTCYPLVRPDVALELAWRHGVVDMAMPFFVQVIREYTGKVDRLIQKSKENKKELQVQVTAQAQRVAQIVAEATGTVAAPSVAAAVTAAMTGQSVQPQLIAEPTGYMSNANVIASSQMVTPQLLAEMTGRSAAAAAAQQAQAFGMAPHQQQGYGQQQQQQHPYY